ncbi:serine/threonine-protein kinase RIO1-like [Oncorhynchus mykiss]|uniref:serine/threonine-protein kinase RIO1-like n=1 Tax=Oncorhynchus mykiss TaxID=8022 RepID=UPI0018781CC1|nr:serine/threonine-protein kinase RIO1-like [Oncorhynchus mykiss]
MFLLNSVAITQPAEEMLAIEGQVSDVSLETPYHDLCEYGDDEEEEEEEEDDDDWDWNETGDLTKRYMANRTGMNHQANKQNLSNKSQKLSTPTDKALRKFEHKINLDKLNYADSVINKVTVMQKQQNADTFRVKDKSDRATVEQVCF